jgi:Tail tubular protein
MALTLTTELDAVNTMLGTIGESPINSLDAANAVADAVTARSILSEVSVQVQEEGWHFNTDYEFVLTPTSDTKEIFVPGNTIEVDVSEYDRSGVDVAIRGKRLYDRKNKTFQFQQPIKADLTILLEFDELPQAARHYISIRAARVFQQRVVGSDTLGIYTKEDEARALRSMRRYESRTADYNILTGSYTVARIIDR